MANDAAQMQCGALEPELSVSVMFVFLVISDPNSVSDVVGAMVPVPNASAEISWAETFDDWLDMMCLSTHDLPAVTTVLSVCSGLGHMGLPAASPSMTE